MTHSTTDTYKMKREIINFAKKFAPMKKFVCLCVSTPSSIMQHESDSEHSTPLSTLPRGAGCKIHYIDCKIIFVTKCKSHNFFH